MSDSKPKTSLIDKLIEYPILFSLIVFVIGFTLIGIHIWYENTTRSVNWIDDLKVETICERIDDALSWTNRPFTDEIEKVANERKKELHCP